ncbi:MAG: amidohydrolase family protein [Chloroflexi bacterium]|nr:amidohydrolase family protein [Chloroflexota bacterium]
MASLVIKNGRIVTPSGVIYGGLAADGEKIIHVGSNASLPPGNKTIDAQNNFVIPGLIDPHVHLAPGRSGSIEESLRAQFLTETEGALHGGVTTLGQFVWNARGKPVVPVIEMAQRVGESASYIDFMFHAGIGDEDHVAEQAELFRRGVTSFKHLFNPPAGWREPGAAVAYCHEGVLYRSLDNIARLGSPAIGMAHCEEQRVINVLIDKLKAEGRNDLAAWTEARPSWVEVMRMQQAFEISRATGGPLYVVHISSAEGTDLVGKWRSEGHNVYGETLVGFLTHTADMEEQLGCWARINPSLKYGRDSDRLWRGIREGSISTVGTDHHSLPREEKEGGGGKHNNIWRAASGWCGGMEHLLPVMMTFGVNAGRISIEDLARVCSTNAARIFGLYPRKGVLSPGSDADLVLVDPEKEAVVDDKFYHCRCEYSIYGGWKLKGFARTTIIRGEVLMEDYRTVGRPGYGRYLPRSFPLSAVHRLG